MRIFSLVTLLLAVCFALGCGSAGIGEECDTSGNKDECVDGAICTEHGGKTTCYELCTEQDECAENEDCNGVSGSNENSCQPKSPEEEFLMGRSLVPCLQNIPVCPDLFARCEMNSTTYAQVRFPEDSPFRFLVSALPNEKIEVAMFFVTQSDPGLNTRIIWYEPGCSQVYEYASEGLNLFQEAEDNKWITRRQTVLEGGDHPIEIESDMRAIVDITVVVIPGSG